jgi:hypothetical protein
MPLPAETRRDVLEYCDAHLPDDDAVAAIFDFLNEPDLQARVEAEFYAARYIYKLGEALAVSDERLHAHVKFQIVQYAGIYEAIIVHMLWKMFPNHQAVTSIEYHAAYRRAADLSTALSLTLSDTDEEIVLCVESRKKTQRPSIKFDDKVDASVAIGFLDLGLGEEIKRFYKLRNAIHLENAIKYQIRYEIDSSSLAFRRMQPFTRGIKGFLATGILPEEGKITIQPSAATLSTVPDQSVGSEPPLLAV